MVVTTAAPGPTEKRSTIGIRYATAGMLCIVSRTGVITRWNPGDRPARTPSGSPIASESALHAHVSANVLMLGLHKPIASYEANAAITPRAARCPPLR